MCAHGYKELVEKMWHHHQQRDAWLGWCKSVKLKMNKWGKHVKHVKHVKHAKHAKRRLITEEKGTI